MTEYRKLKDWNPQKGDVFQSEYARYSKLRCLGDTFTIDWWEENDLTTPRGVDWFQGNYRLVSRANLEPKPFGDLSPEEKKELLNDWVDGKTVEGYFNRGRWEKIQNPVWVDSRAYRIKPEPTITKETRHYTVKGMKTVVEYTLTDDEVTDVNLV